MSNLVKNSEEASDLLFDIRQYAKNNPNGDLNHFDVSNIEDMSGLFSNLYKNENNPFNGDISKWDVSNVKRMDYMFNRSNFNGDISNWDVSNVFDMTSMFANSKFKGDISNWNTKSLISYDNIFLNCDNPTDIRKWDLGELNENTELITFEEYLYNYSHIDIRKLTFKETFEEALEFLNESLLYSSHTPICFRDDEYFKSRAFYKQLYNKNIQCNVCSFQKLLRNYEWFTWKIRKGTRPRQLRNIYLKNIEKENKIPTYENKNKEIDISNMKPILHFHQIIDLHYEKYKIGNLFTYYNVDFNLLKELIAFNNYFDNFKNIYDSSKNTIIDYINNLITIDIDNHLLWSDNTHKYNTLLTIKNIIEEKNTLLYVDDEGNNVMLYDDETIQKLQNLNNKLEKFKQDNNLE